MLSRAGRAVRRWRRAAVAGGGGGRRWRRAAVAAGRCATVPSDDVEDGVGALGGVEAAEQLGDDGEVARPVLVPRVRVHEVAGLGEPVCPNRAELRKAKVGPEGLEDVATRAGRPGGGARGEADAARDDAHLARLDAHPSELCDHVQRARLRHEEEVSVRVGEGGVEHGRVARVEVDRDALLERRPARAAHGHQTLHKGDWRASRQRERPPAVRIGRGDGRGVGEVGLQPAGQRLRGAAAHGWRNPVEPRALVGRAWRREGGARKLLGVEAQRRLLRRVLADRQRAQHSLGGDVRAEAGELSGL